jgi:hypothetical protein
MQGKTMTTEERVQTALRNPEPVLALRALVQELAREGSSKTAIYDSFEKGLLRLRGQPDFCESDEDAILDVMDALSGSCHPSAELLPEKPGR